MTQHVHCTPGVLRWRSTCHGFTLIELLVVIGIIAIVAGIVVPAVNSVQAAGKQVKCAAQLRQLADAMRLYSQDNEDLYPCWGWEFDELSCSWANPSQSVLEKSFSGGLIWRYAQESQLFTCPSGPSAPISNMSGHVWGFPPYFSYVVNGSPGYCLCQANRPAGGGTGWLPNAPNWCVRMNDIKPTASDVMMLFEQSALDAAAFDNSNALSVAIWVPGNDSLSGIHGAGGNIAFFDGHVAWMLRQSFIDQCQSSQGTLNLWGGYVGYMPP